LTLTRTGRLRGIIKTAYLASRNLENSISLLEISKLRKMVGDMQYGAIQAIILLGKSKTLL
jgi:hypothetical protein